MFKVNEKLVKDSNFEIDCAREARPLLVILVQLFQNYNPIDFIETFEKPIQVCGGVSFGN